ncbi:MAG: hypothetical protein LCH95_19185 [Proteobacteria bacterium]|nr:hypothetical protein [Pseudomonadota bacterium]
MTDPDKETDPLASPACSASEASDVYMGFAGPDEIAAFLAELAAAEQAGRPIDDRLRAMLPRIRDDALHAALAARLGAPKKA